ncbi:histone acetyltransferase KAT7-like isoform X2 [Daphnia pulex]|uniref:histone acetyltransferase KAT7-like isoform X2 n=1 Tax=Daphnia pulex TaxID=6669 RepID=UPI001EE00009|nr:histone acetyltransferase KAT7-like isoform X2 [Daphnia pulex]
MSSKPKKKVSSSEDTSSSSSSDSSSSSSSSGSDSSSSDSESSQASAPKQCNKKKVNRTRVSSTNSSSDSAPKKETPVKKEEPKKKQNNAPTKAKPPQPSKKPAAAAVPAKAVKKPPAKNSTPVKKQPQPSSSATVSEASNKSPKLQQKMRSIFSPENSSMSSDSDVPTIPKKSAVLQSSEASDTDTESGNQVNQPKSKGPRARVQPRPAARKSSESEAETKTKGKQPARKLTRSSSARIRKSKHVIGKVSDSDSEVEVPVSNKSSSATGKRKPAAAKGKSSSIGNRKLTPKEISSYSGSAPSSHESCNTPSVEEKKCPMAGCDSSGHLNGKTDRHLSLQACPSYHNLTMSECAALRLNAESQINHWSAISTNRQDFHVRTPRSPRSSGPTSEQLKEQQKVRQARAQKSERKEIDTSAPAELDENAEDKWREREPNLTGLTSEYDLALFRASQAEASTKYEDELKSLPSAGGLRFIEMGRFEMEVWYQSPYPDDLARLPKLYLCEFCLVYMRSRTVLRRHAAKCVWRHPPGDEIYRKEKVSVWEVDGQEKKTYCQNLCLLAKCFLDTKTLYYDVEPFLFYVMTVADSEGCHSVGYFSKEKNSFLNYNVSCIMTLPPYQRQGYGRLLIDFSYLLTRTEGKVGSPEKPLSDLGLISYRSYWKDVLLEHVCSYPGKEISIKDLSQEMAINAYDIVSTLQALGMMKYWKGKHIVLKKRDVIEEYQERAKRRGPEWRHTDSKYLRWRPFVVPQETPP